MEPNHTLHQLPVGFTMALAQNTNAMQAFSHLDQNQQDQLIRQARSAQSRDDMNRLVSSLLS